jgi:hypothetical protein
VPERTFGSVPAPSGATPKATTNPTPTSKATTATTASR